jgi:purine catabolism regulator
MQLADQLALPLIEIPSDVPFTALTNPVMKAIVDNQNKRLRFSEEMNKKFIDLEINGGGFQQIADVLGALLVRSACWSHDASFYMLAMSAGALPEEWLLPIRMAGVSSCARVGE